MRGRPPKSQIRQNIIEILFNKRRAYGYEIYNCYIELFPKCTREVVYYHLRTGTKPGEFSIEEIKVEHGDFSWGSVVEKIYYKLGPNAQPNGDIRIANFFTQKGSLK